MHICFIAIDHHESQSGGGIASYVHTLGEALAGRGHRITVLAKGEEEKTHQQSGMRIIQLPLGNLHWWLYKLHAPSCAVLPVREFEWSLGFRRRLSLLHAQDPIDLIESSEIGALFLSFGRNRLPPYLIRLHGNSHEFQKYSGQRITMGLRISHALELLVLRRANGVTAPSRFQAREFAGELHWPLERISMVPNPIAPWLLQEASRNSPNADTGQKPMVLYTGRIEARKGTMPLLRSVPYVSKIFPDMEYVLAGGRHNSISERTLNQALDQEGIRTRVRLLGHIAWKELPSWYRRAQVFVMPSLCETFCISVVEAMAFGLPVVAAKAGSLPELVEDGVTGFLVPPKDPQALAQATLRLLQNPRLRLRMGEAGRKQVLARFQVKNIAEEMLRIYEKTVQEH